MNLPGIFRLTYRLPLLLLHVAIATPVTVLCQGPRSRAILLTGQPFAEVLSCWWSRVICRIFGIRRRLTGDFHPGAQLVVANHISWIDIALLHSFTAMGFVAKAEIEGWPLLGTVARAGGSVFHRRGSHDSASGVAESYSTSPSSSVSRSPDSTFSRMAVRADIWIDDF